MRRGLAPVIGSRIEAVERPPCRRRPIAVSPRIDAFDRRCRNRIITQIGRRGKRVMIYLHDAQIIAIEPRMTGLVLLADPPTEDHLRLRLRLSGGPHHELLFWDRRGLGTVRLLSGEESVRAITSRLGIDALAVTPGGLRDRLRHSRRAVKVALLDQTVVAGIGNLYAAEILFVAGVDPRARCDRLSQSQWDRIASATRLVLQEAIHYEGSTLADGTYRNALNRQGSYQNHHRVYGRQGERCPRCREAPIRRIVQAQRSTFFCAVCQRKTGIHALLRTVAPSPSTRG